MTLRYYTTSPVSSGNIEANVQTAKPAASPKDLKNTADRYSQP